VIELSIHRYLGNWCLPVSVLLLACVPVERAWPSWDGEPSLEDIVFSFESFVDINAYQFRPSEEIKWYEVENGFRAIGGSLDHNLLYVSSDLRLKQDITSNVNFRLWWSEEELYESRELQRPVLEIEVRPDGWPGSLSLIGSPEYAKREADIGLAATLGHRPWNYLRVSGLSPDLYYNEKNVQDGSHYRRESNQWTVEAAYKFAECYKLRFWWQDNQPLEFVLDDQVSVFTYENRSYRATFDYHRDAKQNYGISVRGFDTSQSLDDGLSPRSQDIRYISVEGYWFTEMDSVNEWTVGVRYDDFRNDERTQADLATSFDFLYKTLQVYTVYHHLYGPQQAWELGLYVGHATKGDDFVDAAIDDTIRDKLEAKLATSWELFSVDRASALNLTMSWNLDELETDPVDGGMMRFSSRF
jgi:hypothetical protein